MLPPTVIFDGTPEHATQLAIYPCHQPVGGFKRPPYCIPADRSRTTERGVDVGTVLIVNAHGHATGVIE